jgi:hypothetical protein
MDQHVPAAATPDPVGQETTTPSPDASAAAAKPHPHTVEITVNGHAVRIEDRATTGLEIKETAIAQGVPIKLDFGLWVEHAPGKRQRVGDQEEIHVHDRERFFAIPPDDNSDIDRADV